MVGCRIECPYFPNIGNKIKAIGGIMYRCQTNLNTKFQILNSIFEDLPPFLGYKEKTMIL
jgi:hypothetical protein